MVKFLILVAVIFGVALGFQWLKDANGQVVLTLADTAYAVDLTIVVIALVAAFLVGVGLLWFAQELLASPRRVALGWRRRNQERGRASISQGLIAVAAGDLRTAERAVQDAAYRTPDMPLVKLLQAQTAQLKGDRPAARRIFQEMTEDPQTRIAGLRGLYVEAEREGEQEAAYQIAELARGESPSSPWAARALLRHQTASSDWDGALKTLSGATDGRVVDKRAARRQRAVILAAKAMEREDGDPDGARHAALEAHELAPDLVPAAVVAGRLLSRAGDIRRAAHVLEATWKAVQHPEVAEAYLQVRAGDSANDRLKRAETLHRMRREAEEGRLAVAVAAIDARDFARAREVLTPVLVSRPTQRALAIMAELEEAETGDRGRAREWLARSVSAPRDPVWTADGVILERWAPASPVTGRLDAVEWKVPVAEIGGSRLHIDAAELESPMARELAPELPAAAPDRAEPDIAAEPQPPEPADAEIVGAADAPSPVPQPASSSSLEPHADSPPPDEQSAETVRPPAPVLVSVSTAEDAGGAAPEDVVLPPLPDDPGVREDESAETKPRRFRVF